MPVSLEQHVPAAWRAVAMPFTTLASLSACAAPRLGVEEEGEDGGEGVLCDNLIRKRRRKMNKHKHSKMLKKQRFLRRKLGK